MIERGSKIKHPLYATWSGMRYRCRREVGYADRGITVCERWNDFWAFVDDMGERPTPQHSIDRIDNDAGYSPENCRWATDIQQSANQRQRKLEPVDEGGLRDMIRVRVCPRMAAMVDRAVADHNAKEWFNPISRSEYIRRALEWWVEKEEAKLEVA